MRETFVNDKKNKKSQIEVSLKVPNNHDPWRAYSPVGTVKKGWQRKIEKINTKKQDTTILGGFNLQSGLKKVKSKKEKKKKSSKKIIWFHRYDF